MNKCNEQQALNWMDGLCDRHTKDGRRQCLTMRCPMRRFWCFEKGGPLQVYKKVNGTAKKKMLKFAYSVMEREGVK